MNAPATVLIMAAGTGGHVFPALSIARALQAKATHIEWLGTPNGMENELLSGTGIPLHQITVSGLRGSGLKRKLMAPIMLVSAFAQSFSLLRKIQPDCVLGMGGFVCGPAGIAAKLLGKPLILHEQNAVAGLTNKLLAVFADRVLEAFPNTFKPGPKLRCTGNPLRKEIAQLHGLTQSKKVNGQRINILVLGGSQGAAAINDVMPEVLQSLGSDAVSIVHQTGKQKLEQSITGYEKAGFTLSDSLKVSSFIEDMPQAYAWCDLVICRSGASTVTEIAAVGKPSILIPYPYHRDDQQVFNARWLSDVGAAIIMRQQDLSAESLSQKIRELISDSSSLEKMGENARAVAVLDADMVIANECLGLANA
ncbi:MAG: UDP-N-acetylglucosamine--N-acetylmuramyl-(pentapeptide) pyrophosphoryl-undecaprenol N-acetylglucosamine transferase [Pseudohongiellaceae bacterium]|jgi:UDP-N-acetylglucosamine--N-acetylmuramyl-(pentapeptide) pyrophosphoryl-undecaprenol N-acetylglucosamine transferase